MTSFNFLYFIIFLLGLVKICVCENNVGEVKEESMGLPAENEATNQPCARRLNSQMHEIRKAHVKQFPFVAALMSPKNEYLCSATVVANGLLLTTAKCLQLPVSYVLLDTTKGKKEEDSNVYHVVKTEQYPSFIGSDSIKDVGLIFTESFDGSVASKIAISNFNSGKRLVDVEGIGFGLNADGQQKDLQSIGMEIRSQKDDILSAYFDCVVMKEPLCYKDKGGPIVSSNELVGIVLSGQEDCLQEVPSAYAINKKMVEILPTYTFKAWVEIKIALIEEKNDKLPVFPSKTVPLELATTEPPVETDPPTTSPKAKPASDDTTSTTELAAIHYINPKLLAIGLLFAILFK